MEKSRYSDNMRTIYSQMVNKENQKAHPFGNAESRFKWVNIYSNGNDLKRKPPQRCRCNVKDNLEGGIGRFLNRNREECQEQPRINRKNKNRSMAASRGNNYYNINTQRVIYPEKDTEIPRVNKRRTYGCDENNLLHTTNGNILSLINKTPLVNPIKGKKRFNNSIDCKTKNGDINIFSDEFLNDREYNRIPGVKRKHLFYNSSVDNTLTKDNNRRRMHYNNQLKSHVF